jgi:hypothetical protein
MSYPAKDRACKVTTDEFTLLSAWMKTASYVRPYPLREIAALTSAWLLAGYSWPSYEFEGIPHGEVAGVIRDAARGRPSAHLRHQGLGVIAAVRACTASSQVSYLSTYAPFQGMARTDPIETTLKVEAGQWRLQDPRSPARVRHGSAC